MMQSFLSLEILFLNTDHTQLTMCNFTDIINVSLRLGHNFSTVI